MQNFVGLTMRIAVVLLGREIDSAVTSEPLPNFQKLAASSVDWIVGC